MAGQSVDEMADHLVERWVDEMAEKSVERWVEGMAVCLVGK